MRMLKLDLTALLVESFEASAGHGALAGTVRGNASGVESCGYVTECQDTCFCADTSPRPSCDECSWNGCVGTAYGESCHVTGCLTCLCPNTSPRPSCNDCSWDGCTM